MRYLLSCLVAFALSAPLSAKSAAASDNGVTRLSPEQTEALQALGQAVLQAKKSLVPDPDSEELKQSAKSLKAVIDEAASISLPANSAQLIVNSQTATHKASTKNSGVPDTADSPALSKRLDQFQVRHAEIESNMLSRAKTKSRLEQQPAYPISLRLRQMSDELDQALKAPPEERQQRLTQLKQRFDKHETASQRSGFENQHRGLTTLVRHYSNEQATSTTPSQRQK
jgi:hypothetical protein